MSLAAPSIETAFSQVREVPLKIVVNANTVAASITTYSSNCPEVFVYKNGDTTTDKDTDVNFGTLANTPAPAVFGLLLRCGDATEFVGCDLLGASIVNGAGLAMTALAVTPKGGGLLGVTTSKNIALSISCTGLNGTAAVQPCTFWVVLRYKKVQPV